MEAKFETASRLGAIHSPWRHCHRVRSRPRGSIESPVVTGGVMRVFRLIGPLMHLPAGSDELAVTLWAIPACDHESPRSRRRPIARSTLREWLRYCRRAEHG